MLLGCRFFLAVCFLLPSAYSQLVCTSLSSADFSLRLEQVLSDCGSATTIGGEPLSLEKLDEGTMNDFLDNKTAFLMDLSLIGSNWTVLKLTSLAGITNGLTVLKNLQLKDLVLTVSAQNDTVPGKIRGNPRLKSECVDYLKAAKIGDIQPYGECLADRPLDSLQLLLDCQSVEGNLQFARGTGDVDGLIGPIKEIRGCLRIEHTNLTNIDFLVGTETLCPERYHYIANNPLLCKDGLRVKELLERVNPDHFFVWEHNCDVEGESQVSTVVGEYKEWEGDHELIVPDKVGYVLLALLSLLALLVVTSPLVLAGLCRNRRGEEVHLLGPYAFLSAKDRGIPEERDFAAEMDAQRRVCELRLERLRKREQAKLAAGKGKEKKISPKTAATTATTVMR